MNLTKKERGHIKGRISKARVIHDVTDTSLYHIGEILEADKNFHHTIEFDRLNRYLKRLVESV